MNARLRVIRKALKLNQTDFAKKLGVTPTAISRIEKGERRFTDQMLKAVCREFSISETWLRTGAGDMYDVTCDGVIKRLSQKHYISETDQSVLEVFFTLPEPYQRMFMNFIHRYVNAFHSYNKSLEQGSDANAQIQEILRGWIDETPEEEAVALVRRLYAEAEIQKNPVG